MTIKATESLSSMSRVLIAYHADCIDGWASAFTAYCALTDNYAVAGANITLLPVQYGNLEELQKKVHSYTHLYVLDFSLSSQMLAHFHRNFSWLKMAVIDHHLTAQERYGDRKEVEGAEVVMDMSECGATLTWKYFRGDKKVPRLLEFVRDYDLWHFNLEGTSPVNKALRVTPKNIVVWSQLQLDIEQDNAYAFFAKGTAIQRYYDMLVEQLLKGAEEITLAGEKGLCVNCPPEFANDVGEVLAKMSGTYGATWSQVKGDVKISLRSIKCLTDTYSVAKLAEKYGGGGHKTAAGFTLLKAEANPGAAKQGVTIWDI